MASSLSSFNSITGAIHNPDGSLLPNVTVKAYSKNLITENLLGTAITNAQGNYKINYTAAIIAKGVFIRIYQDEVGKTLLGQSPITNMKPGALTIDFTLPSPPGDNIISGTIYDVTDAPKLNAYVELYERKLGDLHEPWGSAVTDNNGFYSIKYSVDNTSLLNTIDAFIKVYETDVNKHKSNLLGESPAYYGIPLSYTINYRIGGEVHKDSTEFNALHNIVTPLLNGKNITQLQPDDLTILAGKTGADTSKIANLSVAYQVAAQLDASKEFLPDTINGLFSQNFPQDLNNLLLTKSSSIRNAIQQGIDANVISYKSQQQIDDTINTLNAKATEYVLKGADARNVSFQNMIKAVLPSNNLQTTFVNTWFAHEDEPEKFWDALGTQIGFNAVTVENVKNIFTLNQLTGNETGLTVLLYGESKTDNDLKDLTGFAKFTKDDWKNRITQVVNDSSFTEFPDWVTGETQDEKIESYVSYFDNLIKSLFPTRVFAAKLLADTNDLLNNKNDLLTFFSNNPEFDLQTNQINSLFDAANFDHVNKEKIKPQLITLNRLSKLSDDYTHVSKLSSDGLDSSASIVKKYSLQKFIEKFSTDFGEETATSIYKKAKHIDNRTTAVATAIKTRNDIPIYVIDGNPDGTYNTSPDYESMFGDNMLCDCEECQSVYGAAAYLVDILKYLDDNIFTDPNPLDQRRPDIKQILLTCQNTNTPLPYIDLVNEILEDAVANTSSAYQTTNTPEELAAYPEHTNGAIYNNTLKTANFSFDLPLNLPLSETRLMLDKLRIHKYELMELFYGKKGDNKYTDINIAAEYLQLSPQELAILNGSDTSIPEIAMDNVNDFLQQTGLTYIEMLQLLESYFINLLINPEDQNSGRTITVVADAGKDPVTCNVNELVFSGTEAAAPKINRFIRLWKNLGWDILDLDKAFTAFGITTADKIDNSFIIFLSHVARMKASFGLSVPVILAIWSDIDTKIYINHTTEGQPLMMSLYQKLFQNKQVTNPVVFNDFDNLSGNLSDQAKTIAAVLNISQTDFEILSTATFIDGSLTLDNLSILFRYATLAKILRITIVDLISLIDITAIHPFEDIDATAQTLAFLDTVSLIRSSGYSVNDLSVLFGKTTIAAEALDVKMISDLFIALREGLKKVLILFPDAANNPDQANLKLQNQNSFIADTLSTALKTESKLITVLLNSVVKSTKDNTLPAITAFISDDFISSEGAVFSISDSNEISWLFPDLYNTYMRVIDVWNRILGLIAKFKITTDEFLYLQNNQDTLGITGIWNLPGGDLLPYTSFENLCNIIRFRSALANFSADWYILFDDVKNNDKTNFIKTFVDLTGIDQPTVELLIGITADVNQKGILNYTFIGDYNNGSNLFNIVRCVSLATNLGSSISDLSQFINADVDDDATELAKSILKSKYDETAWLDVIKPISNQLRLLKRDALASYLINKPDSTWKNTNDLYAHFLIDVEMDACMVTSRIKQAINSVQLFVDRCLLNLEKDSDNNLIILPEDFSNQWNTWRKQYRVWEANRKIFLYPENWIEPELRDDKTPFFKDLESTLRQNDITDETATDALLSYLEKLDTVANLEMVGLFPDEETLIVHVIGRTRNIPHQYFYRKQENNIWSAWEKMDVDIESDHILPVVWNNRLLVFWGMFTEKQNRGSNNTTISPSTEGDSSMSITTSKPTTYFEFKLAWSEYKNGKWGGKKISNDTLSPIRLMDTASLKLKMKQDGPDHLPPVVILPNPHGGDGDDTPQTPTQPYDNRVLLKSQFLITSSNDEELLFITLFQKDDEDKSPTKIYKRGTFLLEACHSIPGIFNDNVNEMIESIQDIQGNKLIIGGTSPNINLSISNQGFFNVSTQIFEIPILNNTPQQTYLLPSHHEIQTRKKTIFFFTNNQNNFYSYSSGIIMTDFPEQSTMNNIKVIQRRKFDPFLIDSTSSDMQFINQKSSKTLLTSFTASSVATQSMSSDFNNSMTQKKYIFQTFYHPYVCELISNLNTKGVDGLFNEEMQNRIAEDILSNYAPNMSVVLNPFPVKEMDFNFIGSYSIYNWELFFHIPLLIATRLTQNQKFEDARKWFHYIFDPTRSSSTDTRARRFWLTQPFKTEINNGLVAISDLITNPDYAANLAIQLNNWEINPFNPHAVARLRHSAYMRCTIMKYIDNLIAWGDTLFQRDTIESINEATLLYILAANLLGKEPQQIPPRGVPKESSYNDIGHALDSLNDAKVEIESFISSTGIVDLSIDIPPIFLFCLPKNDILLGYWDIVADRLFKIRHCMNIEGVIQQLPLFEPPIDPGLLVRAAAAGLDLNSILNNVNVSLPNYRFQIILQKANELCSDVRALGGELLSSLEKQDAEKLSLLRSTHEIQMLNAVRDIKVSQRDEAQANLDSLNASRNVTEERLSYYQSNASSYVNASEKLYFDSTTKAIQIQEILEVKNYLASVLAFTPEFKFGSGFTIGSTFGGSNLAGAEAFATNALQSIASLSRLQGESSNMKGIYDRRMNEWQFQTRSATLELVQIDKQILAAQIRLDIAEKDLEHHDLQIEQSKEVDDYMRSKFTNAELYDWMVGQISAVYFQSYQLAYNAAKKAEKCMQYELGIENTSFIQYGYWDSLKKGLLSGERLQYDLRRLENAYMEQNIRELEITKHISVALINPVQLLQLKETGTCNINLPEELFDLDFPGHYFRRIKSVSISIPCIAGPYTPVNATLKLNENEYRINTEVNNGYPKAASDETRFRTSPIGSIAIATSSAQMDSGMFELNFRDERYLPFEGAGAASTWSLELMTDPTLRQFNYETISDVIIHLRYTSQDGVNTDFKNAAIQNLRDVISNAATSGMPLSIAFDMKHDFADEWHRFINDNSAADTASLALDISKDMLPFFAANNNVEVSQLSIYAKKKDVTDKNDISFNSGQTLVFDEGNSDSVNLFRAVISNISTDITNINDFTYAIEIDKLTAASIDNMFIVLLYKLSQP